MNITPQPLPRRAAKTLYHDADRYLQALGCETCKDRDYCGGINISGGLFDCTAQCCGKPHACQWVCRNNPNFVRHVQSLRGFSLDNIRVNATKACTPLPAIAPLVFHGYRRTRPLDVPFVAIKLVQLLDRRNGSPRFVTRGALTSHFKLAPDTQLIASGVDHDPIIERWWSIGAHARRDVIAAMKACGIAIVTCPNYSLCLDWPRTGDLAAIKRIAICYEEFTSAGLPAALHVNGRTDTDFARWAELLKAHPSITHVSYEFTTGAAHAVRRPQHIAWLSKLAGSLDRPLDLIIYGDSSVAHALSAAFRTVTWIDTSSFIKAIHRQKATRLGNGQLVWHPHPTEPHAPIDDLIAHNVAEAAAFHALRQYER